MFERIRRLVRDWASKDVFLWSIWGLLLLTIPLSSFPFVAKFTGKSTVSPMAGLSLMLLLTFWYIPYLFRGGNLPVISAPLIFFVGVALLASALAPFQEIYPFLGRGVYDRSVRALVTLAAGVGFYLVAATAPNSDRGLRKSLQWLYLGAIFMLLWSTVQAFFVFGGYPIPSKLKQLHRFFSIRDMSTNRVTGFAYEPSWLADQLVLLYLPLWLSSVLKGYTAFSFKLRGLSVELGLLFWGAAVLFLSLSRIGLLSLFVSLGALGLAGGWRLTKNWVEIVRRRKDGSGTTEKAKGVDLLRVAFWMLLVLLSILIMLTIVFLASRLDPRIERMFQTDFYGILKTHSQPIYTLANRLAYAERVMYWTVGLRVFSQYPMLGVGLGNTGFFFLEELPAFGYHLPETIRIINGSPWFPNPKNLWVRLLAETGIVGFIIFVVWMFVLALGAWFLIKRGKGIQVVLGMAGLLALLAQIFEGFSLDSFALPQLWIILGLMTAALSLHSTIPPHSSKTAHRLE